MGQILKNKTAQPQQFNIHMIALNKVTVAPWNPPRRVTEERLYNLAESIDDIGLIYPIVLTEKLQIFDGHKRVTIAKSMGWEVIPYIKTSSEFLHTYGSLNANQERMTGNDLIGIYMLNPLVLIQRQKTKIERVEKLGGTQALKALYVAGLSTSAFDLAMRVVRYVHPQEFHPNVVLKWLIKHEMLSPVRHLIADGVPAGSLVRAINDDRPVKTKVTTAD